MKEKQKSKLSVLQYLKERHKRNIAVTVLLAMYALFCVGSLIYFAVLGNGHTRDCIISLAYLAVIPVFYAVEYFLDIRAPFLYVLFILVYCVFCFLGASYNFYTTIPYLDDILHAGWGLLFCTLGFCVIKSLLGEPKTTKAFVAYLIFAVGFCMILSIVWEIYEYTFDNVTSSFDMQEDTIVNRIHSFMLHDPYDHLNTFNIDGITYTEIHYSDGRVYTIEGGYLDIGLVDTMMDIIWCMAASVAFCVVIAVDRKFGAKLCPHLVPVYLGKRNKEEEQGEVGGDSRAVVDAVNGALGETDAVQSAESEASAPEQGKSADNGGANEERNEDIKDKIE